MGLESGRDLVLRKESELKALRGVQAIPSADPFLYVADDGQKFTNLAEMTAHNMSIVSRDAGNRNFETTENRLHRSA